MRNNYVLTLKGDKTNGFMLLRKAAPVSIDAHPVFSIIFMKISTMKRVLVVLMGLFMICSARSQTPNNVPDPPYLKNPGIPPFKLLKVDSVHFVTREDLKKNHRVLIMFFSPECDHCKHQMKDILADYNKFKDIEIVMATYQPFDEMKSFYEYFRIADHPEILMGRDEKFMLPPYFRMQSLPCLVLYDKKGQFVKKFEGNQKVDTLLNAFDTKYK
jgi:thioredoxin-related protein